MSPHVKIKLRFHPILPIDEQYTNRRRTPQTGFRLPGNCTTILPWGVIQEVYWSYTKVVARLLPILHLSSPRFLQIFHEITSRTHMFAAKNPSL